MEEFELLSNGMRIVQTNDLFRLSTDSILLADFCIPLRAKTVADLGCGGGALGVLLCAADPACRITGIEIQPRACEIARRNVQLNHLADRFRVIQADLCALDGILSANTFDAVVSNPPYFPAGSGAVSGDEAIAIARSEQCCTFDALCAAAGRLLRYGGSFFLVHRPERLAELMDTLRSHRLEPKRLRFIRHRPDAPVSLILLESRLGANVGVRIEPDLILYESSGAPTEAYRRIYHIP